VKVAPRCQFQLLFAFSFSLSVHCPRLLVDDSFGAGYFPSDSVIMPGSAVQRPPQRFEGRFCLVVVVASPEDLGMQVDAGLRGKGLQEVGDETSRQISDFLLVEG